MPIQPVVNAAPEWCFLIRHEEQAAVLHGKYLRYVVHFERWDTRKGWLRFSMSNPVSGLAAIAKSRPLPKEWRQQPLSEDDFTHDLYVGYVRPVSATD